MSTDRALEFPKPGGAYDSYSRLIFTHIEGNQTYRNRLERYAETLYNELMAASVLSGVNIRVRRRVLNPYF